MIRIVKRAELPKNREWVIRAGAVFSSVIFAGIVIAILGVDPVKAFTQIVNGSIGSQMRLIQTVLKAVPLTITSMGILVAFKMKFWNIGGEGQIMMGAMGAAYIALHLPETLPMAVMLAMMALAAMFCGGVWAFIPAFFKARFKTNETIFTLMMNYIAIKWVTYLQFDVWKDAGSAGFPRVAPFPANAVLPRLFGVHIGWLIAVCAVIIIYVFINHTKKGYEITVLGESMETARYAGMNIKYIMVAAMMVSGGLCGLTGMVQASGIEKTLTYSLSANFGFTAIITTWLGRLSAPAIAVVCFVFAMLIQGGTYLQIALSIPSSVAEMIQGIILFFVLGSEFFIQYRTVFRGPAKKGVA